jgi:hypothetical protein
LAIFTDHREKSSPCFAAVPFLAPTFAVINELLMLVGYFNCTHKKTATSNELRNISPASPEQRFCWHHRGSVRDRHRGPGAWWSSPCRHGDSYAIRPAGIDGGERMVRAAGVLDRPEGKGEHQGRWKQGSGMVAATPAANPPGQRCGISERTHASTEDSFAH